MSKKINIVADVDIPFLKGVLEPFANITYYKGSQIGRNEINDADALIIRTRTKCNSSLLSGSNVKFIASATIGSDHVDVAYCKENGIYFTNAAGCNSWGVVQYVLTAIFAVGHKNNISLNNKTIGIIGAGNVGERLAVKCESLGFKVLRCDPPVKKRIEINPFLSRLTPDDFYDMEIVAERADILSLHVPLDESTKLFFGQEAFGKMKNGAIFINSSRGEVVDESALCESRNKLSSIVVDVWNNEPEINLDLLNVCDIATPHIAGYSLEGKINATVMVVNKLAEFFSINELKGFTVKYPEEEKMHFTVNPKLTFQENLYLLLSEGFDIFKEDNKLREQPEQFEKLRSDYTYRREISEEQYSIIENINPKLHW